MHLKRVIRIICFCCIDRVIIVAPLSVALQPTVEGQHKSVGRNNSTRHYFDTIRCHILFRVVFVWKAGIKSYRRETGAVLFQVSRQSPVHLSGWESSLKRTVCTSSIECIFSPSIRWANPDRTLMAALTSADNASRSFIDFRAFNLGIKSNFSNSRDRYRITKQANVAVDVYFERNVESTFSQFKISVRTIGQ